MGQAGLDRCRTARVALVGVGAALLGCTAPALAAASRGEAGARVAKAQERPDLAVSSVPRAPGPVRAGQRLRLRVTVANRGRGRAPASELRILLSERTRPDAAARVLGKARVGALTRRDRRSATVAVKLPSDLAPGQALHLVACADGARKVRETNERNNCRALPGRVARLSGTSHEVIEAAERLGMVGRDQAIAYKLFATFRDRRLPAAYRGSPGRTSLTDVYAAARSRLPRMRRALRLQVAPYLIPPIYRGSFGDRRLHAKPRGKARRAGASSGFKVCNVRLAEWRNVKPGALPVRVWWRADHANGESSAKRLAGELERQIWPRLVGLMGPPDDDSRKICSNLDGALDIYLHPLASHHDGGATEYDAYCGKSPGWIVVDPNAPGAVLAHEVMHILQFAHPRSEPCDRWSYLNDATATWAEDFTYPGVQTEHVYHHMLADPSIVFGYGDGYPGWVFFKSATEGEGGGPGVVKTLYALAKGTPPLAALDAALPGGLKRAWPEFARQGWNRRVPPAMTQTVFHSDRLETAPPAPRVPLVLRGDASSEPVHIRFSGLGRQYAVWDLSDRQARHVTFNEPGAPGVDPGLHAQAFFRLADGTWKHEDWTNRVKREFCRDEAAEDVREVVLIHSTSTLPSAGDPSADVVNTNRPSIGLRKRCEPEELHLQVTEYRSVKRAETDRGWSERDRHLASGSQPVFRVKTVKPDDPSFMTESAGENATFCQLGEPCSVSVRATTQNVSKGWVDGPYEECPFDYGTQTFGPFENIGIDRLVLDFSSDARTARLESSVGHLEVGDVYSNTCRANSWARLHDPITTPVSYEQLAGGEPVTATFQVSGSTPTQPHSASATITYTVTQRLTLRRVKDDGSPWNGG